MTIKLYITINININHYESLITINYFILFFCILQGFDLLLLMVFTSVDLVMLAAEWGGLAFHLLAQINFDQSMMELSLDFLDH